jgi:hypothetical protein
MTLSRDGCSGDVSRKVTYLSARSPLKSASGLNKRKRMDDPWASQTEGRVGDLKRRIPILIRLIADCDHLAGDLDSEVRNEENRVKIHDHADPAYSMYARAAALRRDNLRRSQDELRAHLTEAKKALHELGETTTDGWSTATVGTSLMEPGRRFATNEKSLDTDPWIPRGSLA